MTTSTTDAEAIREAFAKVVVESDRDWSGNVASYRKYLVDRLTDCGLFVLASRREAVANDDIANALEKCDWSGASIGNKAIISAAVERLRENVLFCQDATDHLALIDYISDKIGLPKDEELSRENFSTWLLASRREAQEPVAWRYRWKIDGEWVSWRVSERSQASEHLLPSLEEYPLYLAPPAPSGEVERLRGALKKIKSLLSYANQNNVTPAARQSNINSAWWQADAALNGGRADE